MTAFSYDPNDPHARGIDIAVIVLLCLSWISIAARFVARRKIRSIGLDDVLILPCQICFTMVVVSILETHNEVLAKNLFAIDAISAVKWFIVNATMYASSMAFLKISLGFFFLRIVSTKTQRYVVYGTVAISVIANFFVVIWTVTNCGGPHNYVTKMYYHQCAALRAQKTVAYMQVLVNIISDIVLACIPFFILRRSFLARNLKISVVGILILATAGCLSSILRSAYVAATFQKDNFSKYFTIPALMGSIEMSAGIICSCLATLKPLISKTRTAPTNRRFAIRCDVVTISAAQEQEAFARPVPAHTKRQTQSYATEKHESGSWFLEKTIDEPESRTTFTEEELIYSPTSNTLNKSFV